jgi:hypothetical protein
MNETMIMNDQIYNNFHQQPNILHNFTQNNSHNNNRHEFYTDNRGGHNLIDQSHKSNLADHQKTIISPSQPYSDYTFKYEKTEDNIIQTNSNTLNSFSDDEEDDDEFDEDDFEENDSNNSRQHNYDYECEEVYSLNNNKNMTKNNCEINPYGNSVFDSPLSLSTLNEDQITASNNTSHLTTLTSTSSRHQERFNRNHLQLDNKNSNKTSSIPSSTSSTLNSLLNVKSEISENFLKNNHMTTKIVTKLPENIPTDSQSLKKSVHHLTNCTLNDYELISLPLRELNKRLRYVPKVTAIDLKKRRRTLKNRKYAQNCRSKRLEQKCEMEHTNTKLKQEINCLKKLIEKYQHDLQVYKTYVEDLTKDPTKISAINLKQKFNFSNNESSLVNNNEQNNSNNNNQLVDDLRPLNRS